MKSKKFFSTFISLSLIFLLMAQNVNAVGKAEPFSDVSGENEFYSAIWDLKNSLIVEGYSDGSFKPEAKINRAEFTKILMLSANIKVSGENCFTDVKDEWFAPYVCTAKELGVVDGYSDGYFRPGKDINFAEASKIISNTFKLIKEKEDPNVWYKNFVYSLEDYSAIPTSVKTFDKLINRGEMAEMVYRLKNGYTEKAYNTYDAISRGEVAKMDTVSAKTFRSCEHVQAYLSQPEYSLRSHSYFDDEFLDIRDDFVTGDMGEGSLMPKSEAPVPESSASDSDYSSTNVQVAGVDEADIVKTDGEYIYVLKGNSVRIVDAKPAENMKEVSSVVFPVEDFYANDMYVSGNRLIVTGSYYGIMPALNSDSEMKMMPPWYEDNFKVYIYDISDKMKVSLFREFDLEGYVLSSRKIGNMLYLVANKYEYYTYPYSKDDGFGLPLYRDSAIGEYSQPVADCSDIAYFPGVRDSNRFLMVFGIPVDDKSKDIYTETVVASGNNIYVSANNLFVAEDRYSDEVRIMGDIYSNEEKTVIHKFGISEKGIDYKGNGIVPGVVLNQFSMDENDGNFRIATTTDKWSSVNSENHLYVLDSDLKVVGKVEGIAKGERIYSVRFVNDRAYMVTFREVDPFFVIDLKDAKNPKILGELKIPGYSDYLHPYDENHIIGFGKDTVLEDSTWGEFPWYQGMKIAMFDVSDVNNPKEKFKTTIGDRGTHSDLLWNHKALLFNKEKNLMAFPVSVAEIPEELKVDSNDSAWTYGETVFQGAYVYEISLDKGFVLKGMISHLSDDELNENYLYYHYYKLVERALYIGDVFYTVSKEIVKAHKLNDLSFVSEAKLGGGDGLGGSYWTRFAE